MIGEMVMMPKVMFDRQQAYQRIEATPVVNHMVDLDMDMKNVLESTLPSDVKLQRYSDLQRRYRIHSQVPEPVKVKPIYYEPNEELLAGIPKQKKKAAVQLLTDISEIADIKFDKDKKLIINDRAVPNSNAKDLINYLSRDTKIPDDLPGANQLLKTLAEHNVADSSIGNRIFQNRLRELKQGVDLEPPETPTRDSPAKRRKSGRQSGRRLIDNTPPRWQSTTVRV